MDAFLTADLLAYSLRFSGRVCSIQVFTVEAAVMFIGRWLDMRALNFVVLNGLRHELILVRLLHCRFLFANRVLALLVIERKVVFQGVGKHLL